MLCNVTRIFRLRDATSLIKYRTVPYFTEIIVFEIIVYGFDHINDQMLVFLCVIMLVCDLVEQSD